MTIFMGIIGECAVFLVVFILAVYPNINNKTISQGTNTVSQSSSVMQAYDENNEIISPDNTIGETNVTNASDVSDDYSEPETEDQNTMNISPDMIRDQLTSEYGEKFTQSEADYAINNLQQ